jgi:hypothetical protein
MHMKTDRFLGDGDSSNELSTPIVDSARRAPPFDNRVFMNDGLRFLTDPLAEEYICIPPDGGLISPGMLPPQEMEVRAALVEAIEAFKHGEQFGFLRRLLRSKSVAAADELLLAKVTALAETIRLSAAHRAASTRLRRSYRGEAHALLEWAEKVANETS